jgi:hypothetical protein
MSSDSLCDEDSKKEKNEKNEKCEELKQLEIDYKKQECKYKENECKLKEAETLLKLNETKFKEAETLLKLNENERYIMETSHQKKLNRLLEDAVHLKNLESRIEIINSLGIKLDKNTDIEVILRLSELLGHDIPQELKEKLKIIEGKIKDGRNTIERLWS